MRVYVFADGCGVVRTYVLPYLHSFIHTHPMQDELADRGASTALLPTARSELDTAHDRGRRIEVPLSAPSPPPSLNPRPRNRTFCTLLWSVLVRVYTAQLHSRFSPQGLDVMIRRSLPLPSPPPLTRSEQESEVDKRAGSP